MLKRISLTNKTLHLSIFIRIWFFFGLIILLGLWFMSYTYNEQVKPKMRQIVEDTLAENANIIAMLIAEDIYNQKGNTPEFNEKIQNALQQKINTNLTQDEKQEINQQIYITDNKGIVIYDSKGISVGQDYSKWNDVYLTLHGKYGVRSTKSNPKDINSSVMYVAAPIYYQKQFIGVISIGKPNSSVQSYIENAEDDLIRQAIWITLISLFLASLVAYWLKHSIDKVRQYAQALAPVNKAPHFHSAHELNQVVEAVENMREKLEDRAYVEHYVNTLTHELKSPLTAIQASAEILKENIPLQDQQQFAKHIFAQSQRLKTLIDRMLLLTRLEQSKSQIELKSFDISHLIKQLLEQYQSQIQQKNLKIKTEIMPNCFIQADTFWIRQTLSNLLDNAIDFADSAAKVYIKLEEKKQVIEITIFNEGSIIPEYALQHIFDRYFSLARPQTQERSSGIGLSIVKQVIEQHHASIKIENCSANDISSIQPHQHGVLIHIQLHKNFT